MHESLVSSSLGLSQSSVSRRQRRRESADLVDENDLPVQQSLIDAVQSCGLIMNRQHITLGQRSKWLNAISIAIDLGEQDHILSTILHCITSYPFVDKLDMVARYTRTIPTHQDDDNLEVEEDMNAQAAVNPSRTLQSLDEVPTAVGNTSNWFYNNTYNSLLQINAVEAHDNGYDGKGVTILITDTGFVLTHQVFQNMTIKDTKNFVLNGTKNVTSTNPAQNRHGTATLSTVGGYYPGIMVGPAYNATYLIAATEDAVGEDYIQEEDNWMAAMEWGEENGAELVTSSLGYTLWYNYSNMNASSRISKAADTAFDKGMVMVNSAGNDGAKGIGAPADGINVIAVGAIDNKGMVTSFSSLGPSADGRIKPEISALGLQNFIADQACDTCYARMSGTSFSCPLTAGAIALIMQRNPLWTPTQVRTAVLSTGSNSTAANLKTGYGILNTWLASNYIQKISASANCSTVKCSGHGGCYNYECYCSPNYYGQFCQFPRVGCAAPCIQRGGHCAKDVYGFVYVCAQFEDTIINDTLTVDIANKYCDGVIDRCGVCGGPGNECPEKAKDSKNKKIIVGAALITLGVLVLITGVIYFVRRRRQYSREEESERFLRLPLSEQ
ncbi:hypothetical protein SAMD00019534_003190 [Acytostelium subglobosum LB1]|uniref:hypothetical protein n=1 Tax=Acytostelium subglobosum LB1 TaxID=1410327 RepID=UPI000644A7D2|nr:hypothetical protein SAMD00019534_003190 [Acytostelium subglobosum LB1]GAM17144.1 hypothetical protein SAMD00019534_003190 [Acytostelium subglobosum LB1]|eukprot:XP_012759206.1 hypothetical protein SAMD00019534_003190 [Acytostelium subglobosum LB1]